MATPSGTKPKMNRKIHKTDKNDQSDRTDDEIRVQPDELLDHDYDMWNYYKEIDIPCVCQGRLAETSICFKCEMDRTMLKLRPDGFRSSREMDAQIVSEELPLVYSPIEGLLGNVPRQRAAGHLEAFAEREILQPPIEIDENDLEKRKPPIQRSILKEIREAILLKLGDYRLAGFTHPNGSIGEWKLPAPFHGWATALGISTIEEVNINSIVLHRMELVMNRTAVIRVTTDPIGYAEVEAIYQKFYDSLMMGYDRVDFVVYIGEEPDYKRRGREPMEVRTVLQYENDSPLVILDLELLEKILNFSIFSYGKGEHGKLDTRAPLMLGMRRATGPYESTIIKAKTRKNLLMDHPNAFKDHYRMRYEHINTIRYSNGEATYSAKQIEAKLNRETAYLHQGANRWLFGEIDWLTDEWGEICPFPEGSDASFNNSKREIPFGEECFEQEGDKIVLPVYGRQIEERAYHVDWARHSGGRSQIPIDMELMPIPIIRSDKQLKIRDMENTVRRDLLANERLENPYTDQEYDRWQRDYQRDCMNLEDGLFAYDATPYEMHLMMGSARRMVYASYHPHEIHIEGHPLKPRDWNPDVDQTHNRVPHHVLAEMIEEKFILTDSFFPTLSGSDDFKAQADVEEAISQTQAKDVVMLDQRTDLVVETTRVRGIHRPDAICVIPDAVNFDSAVDRYYYWKSVDWSTTHTADSVLLTTIMPRQFILDTRNTPNAQPFYFHRFYRGEMEIRVVANASKFHRGAIQVTWYSAATEDRRYSVFRERKEMISQRPHEVLNLGVGNEVTLKIPYQHFSTYLFCRAPSLRYKKIMDQGNLCINVLNTLGTNDAAATTVNLGIFVRFTSADFQGLMPRELLKEYEPEYEGQMFSLSNIVNAAAKFLAEPNRDKPPAPIILMPVVPGSTQTMCHGDAKASAVHTMRLQSDGQTPHPDYMEDEMSFSFLRKQKGLFKTVEWTFAQDRNKSLFTVEARPHQNDANTMTIDSTSCSFQTPIANLAAMHQYWRGSLDLHLEFVATQFHTGRLMVAYVPGAITTDAFTLDQCKSCPNVILDLRELQDVTIRIPFMSPRPWQSFPNVGSVDEKFKDCCGMLYCFVVNGLKMMGGADSTLSVWINLYLSGADDFEVAIPVSGSYGSGLDARRNPPDKDFAYPLPGYRPMYSSYWSKADAGKRCVPFHATTAGAITQFANLKPKTAYAAPSSVIVDGREYPYRFQVNTSSAKVTKFDTIVAIVRIVDAAYDTPFLFFSLASAKSYIDSGDPVYAATYIAAGPWEQYQKYTNTWVTLPSESFSKWVEVEEPKEMEAQAGGELVMLTSGLESLSLGAGSFGESFGDMKTLARRSALYARCTIPTRMGTGVMAPSVVIPVLYQGLRLESGIRSQSEVARDTHIQLIASAYRYARGGLRFKIICRTQSEQKIQLAVQYRPNLFTHDGYIHLMPEGDAGPAMVTATTAFDSAYPTVWQSTGVNQVIEIEVPYYSSYDFICLQQPDLNTEAWDREAMSLGSLFIYALDEKDRTVAMDIFYELADDCRFYGFIGFPPGFVKDKAPTVNEFEDAMLAAMRDGMDGQMPILDGVLSVETDLLAQDSLRTAQKTLDTFQVTAEMTQDTLMRLQAVSENANVTMRRLTDGVENLTRIASNTSTDIAQNFENVSGSLNNMSIAATKITSNVSEVRDRITAVASGMSVEDLQTVLNDLLGTPVSLQLKADLLVEIAKAAARIAISKSWGMFGFEMASLLHIAMTRLSILNMVQFSTEALADLVQRVYGFFQGSVLTPQAYEAECDAVGMFISGILAIVGISSPPSKKLTDHVLHTMRVTAMLDRTAQGISKAIESFMSMCGRIYAWALGKINPDAVIIDDLESGAMRRWATEIEVVENILEDKDFFGNRHIVQHIFDLNVKAESYQRAMLAQTTAVPRAAALNILITKARKLLQVANDWTRYSPVRFEPYVLYMYGQPGIGKSFLMEFLSMELMRMVGLPASTSEVFIRNPGVAFWNGFNHQEIIRYDDFHSVSRPMGESEATELMALKTCAAYNPPFASIEEKTKLANPKFVLIAANSGFPEPGDIMNSTALWRRRDTLVEVRTKGKMSLEQIRALQPEAEPTFEHLEFSLVKDPSRYDSHKSTFMTYVEFKKYLEKHVNTYMEKEKIIYQGRIKNYISSKADVKYDQFMSRLTKTCGLMPDAMTPQAPDETPGPEPTNCQDLYDELESSVSDDGTFVTVTGPLVCVHRDPTLFDYIGDNKYFTQEGEIIEHRVCSSDCLLRTRVGRLGFFRAYMVAHPEIRDMVLELGAVDVVLKSLLPVDFIETAAHHKCFKKLETTKERTMMMRTGTENESVWLRASPTTKSLYGIALLLGLTGAGIAAVYGSVRLVNWLHNVTKKESKPDLLEAVNETQESDQPNMDLEEQARYDYGAPSKAKRAGKRIQQRKWKPHYKPQATNGAVSSIIDKIAHNTVWIQYTTTRLESLRCLGVYDHVVIFPRHYLDVLDKALDEGKDVTIRWSKLTGNWADIRDTVESEDRGGLSRCVVNQKWCRFKDLRDAMPKDEAPTSSKGMIVETKLPFGLRDLPSPHIQKVRVKDSDHQQFVRGSNLFSPWYIKEPLTYDYGGPGVCGSILVVEETNRVLICGMHTAGVNTLAGASERLTQLDYPERKDDEI